MTARSDFGFRVLVGFGASCTTESCFPLRHQRIQSCKRVSSPLWRLHGELSQRQRRGEKQRHQKAGDDENMGAGIRKIGRNPSASSCPKRPSRLAPKDHSA